MGNWYNGYSWPERMAKFRQMQRVLASSELAAPAGPCRLCGDPGDLDGTVVFEYHDEDYSLDYRWTEPAAYCLCHDCHIYRLHQRFARPMAWLVFIAHVRRGGYARELKEPSVERELAKYRLALRQNHSYPKLKVLRPYEFEPGTEWFARISLDLESMTDASTRPRP
jgi:hypothetical protein